MGHTNEPSQVAALTISFPLFMSLTMVGNLFGIGAVTPESFEATKVYLTWTVLYGGVPTVASLMLGHLIRAESNTK